MYKNALEAKKQEFNLASINLVDDTLVLSGEWSWIALDEKILCQLSGVAKRNLTLDGSTIDYLDTTGAFFLHKLIHHLQIANNTIQEIKLIDADKALLEMTAGIALTKNNPLNEINKDGVVTRLGAGVVSLFATVVDLVTFFGHLMVSMLTMWRKSHPIYVAGILETVASAGIGGIGITSLLCFLIGVNLTYQMSPQFVTYGANVYVVNFLGIALLREVTPLLTAVIVAGRTGSAITASIGTMKVQEEIDALQTMGISSIRRLVLPRIIGLLISLPILTMLADVASMGGGMLVAGTSLGVDSSLFLHRLQSYVSINNYAIGIAKSFAFAFIIGMVGCFRGFRVKGNADSIGVQTTRSVVMSICLIIFVDALFAILFKSLGM